MDSPRQPASAGTTTAVLARPRINPESAIPLEGDRDSRFRNQVKLLPTTVIHSKRGTL